MEKVLSTSVVGFPPHSENKCLRLCLVNNVPPQRAFLSFLLLLLLPPLFSLNSSELDK